MGTSSAVANRLRGIWMSVVDFHRSRGFYERLGAHFEQAQPADDMVSATLGGTRLIFEVGVGNPQNCGPVLLVDVSDADALHAEMLTAGFEVEGSPKDEPWGRRFNVRDPDGHTIACIGPAP